MPRRSARVRPGRGRRGARRTVRDGSRLAEGAGAVRRQRRPRHRSAEPGATHADLVDSSRDARQAIAENLQKTGLAERASVHGLTSETAVSTFRGPYDLILLDPPYDAEGVRLILEQIAGSGLLARSGVVVWEHSRSTTPPERIGESGESGGLQLLRTRQHGAAAVSLYAPATPTES